MRSVITDLSPGQVYYIQAQTASDDGVSEWSPRVELNTAVDTLAPATPNGLTIAMASSTAVLTWNQVITNANGTLCNDLKGYRVTVKSASSAAAFVKDNGLSSKMEFSYDQNRKTFGVAKNDLYFEVQAVDTLDNYSQVATSSTLASTPPPAPANLRAVGLNDSVVLNWDKVNHPGLAAYRVYQGTTANFALTTPIFEGSTTAYLHDTSMYNTDHYYKVVAVDMFEKVSTPAVAGPVRPNNPFKVDTNAPGVPTNLAVTLSNLADGSSATAVLTWTASSNPDGDLAEYVIAYRPVGSNEWQYTTVTRDATTTRLDYLKPFQNYEFKMLARDSWANESNYTATVTKVATANAAPATVTGVTLTAGKDSITASWTANTEADVANGAGTYRVEFSPSSTFASGVLSYRTGATAHTVAGVNENTTYYVRVKAVDSGALESANWSAVANAKTGLSISQGDIDSAVAGKSTVLYQSNEPTASYKNATTLWIDTTSGNYTPKRWNTTSNTWDVVTDKVAVDAANAVNTLNNTTIPAIESRALSRGTDLVTNGTGYLKNNTNFSAFTADLIDVPTGATTAFSHSGPGGGIFADELIPFDPSKKYRFGFMAKQLVSGATNRIYAMLAPFDSTGQSIQPYHYAHIVDTTTTLAQTLNPGDTKIYLTSGANWYGQSGKASGTNSHIRSIIWWDYVDANGKAWPVGSYSRNWSGNDYWSDGGIVGNVITLKSAYAGPVRPAGTPLSNGSAGGSYIYMPRASNEIVPESWKPYSDIFSAGIMSPTQQQFIGSGSATWDTGMPPGTAQFKIGWIINYTPSPANPIVGKHSIAAVSVSDASAAQATADASKALTDKWAFTGTTEIDGGNLRTDTVKASVIQAGSTFTQNLTVGSQFTLGDATTNGTIISYGYTDAGNSGFKLSKTGLVIKGSGNSVSASAFSAGDITAAQINLKAGGSLVIDAAGGELRSSNWATKSTGFKMNTTLGLEVNDGDINAKVLRANSSIVNEIILGSATSGPGALKSYNYSDTNKTGFRLNSSGLTIYDGTIEAKALNLQWGQNLYHPGWADFEFDYRYYLNSEVSGAQRALNFSTARFGRSSMVITWLNDSSPFAWFANPNESPGRVDPNKNTIVSLYVNQADVYGLRVMASYKLANGTFSTPVESSTINVGTGWQRLSAVFTPPATATGEMRVGLKAISGTTLNKIIYIDGVQVEDQMGASTQPSSWTPPSSTTIDGGAIKTGAIYSNSTGPNNTGEPAWSIDTQGAARFANALITDQLIVGEGENYSAIKSMNYSKNKSGWIIDSTGRFEANEGVFRGRLGLGVVQSNLVSDSSFESETPISSSFTQNSVDKWTYWGSGTVGGNFQWGWAKTKAGAKSGHSSARGKVLATNSSNLQSPLFAMIPGRTYEVTYSFLRENNVGDVSLTQRLFVNGSEWKTTDPAYGAVAVTPEPDSIKYTVGGQTTIINPVNNSVIITNPPVATNAANIDGTEFVTVSATYVVPADKPFGTLEFNLAGLTAGTTNWNYIMLDDISVIEHGKGGTELTSAGIRLFDVYGQEAGAFVHNRPNYLSVGESASISQDGKAKFAGVDVPDITFGDVPLFGDTVRAFNDTVNLKLSDEEDALPATSLMDRRGRGYIGRLVAPATSYATTGAVRQKTFLLWPGRAYRFTLSGGPVTNTLTSGSTQSVGMRAHLSFPTNPWAPTAVENVKTWVPDNAGTPAANPSATASTVLLDSRVLAPPNVSGVQSCPSISKVITIAPDGKTGTGFSGAKAGYMNVVLGAVTGSSSNSLVLQDEMEMTIEDIGATIVDNTGDPASSPTRKVAKTRTTILKDRANFQGTGGANDTEFQDPDFQAWQGYWAGRSNVKSYFYFGTGAIPSGLAAADIIKVEVYLYSTYWYNGAGSAAIRLHGAADKTTVNNTTVKPAWTAGGGVIATASMGKNQGKWVALPRSTYQYFANGTAKGFGLEAPTQEVQNKNLRYSGKIEGHAGFEYDWKRAKIKITYLQAA